jgi:hypothetical protein
VDISLAARLYQQGLTLRQVAAALGLRSHGASVLFALRKAGIPRRSWDPRTGGATFRPRVEYLCDSCGLPISRREYYFELGNGTRTQPNPPESRYCSPGCRAWGARQRAIEKASRTVTIEVTFT